MNRAIVVDQISKKYKIYDDFRDRLFDLITPKEYGEDFYALSNVSFAANKGEVVGFVGVNGSGKSTLANILSGIVPQTSGEYKIDGEVSIIAVAAGLNGDLTGRENIELKLLMLGFDKKEIQELEPGIIEFSELEQFIDQPVKSYSSGMRSRLGFAISVNIDPDVLIIDEALSVGDRAFAEKSFNKMMEFKREGKTMIFVSHSLSQMRKFCDKILWLEFGMVKDYGSVDEVLPKYANFLDMWKEMSKKERDEYKKLVINKEINYEKFVKDFWKLHGKQKEKLVSRVGKIRRNNNVRIYDTPKDLSSYKEAKNYLENTYYIKKRMEIYGERFYQLSYVPSSVYGIIGWVRAKDIRSRRLVLIDTDMKMFEISSKKGRAYRIPWGRENDIVYSDLSKFTGESFYVERTEQVGSKQWYLGKLNEQKVWINEDNLVVNSIEI